MEKPKDYRGCEFIVGDWVARSNQHIHNHIEVVQVTRIDGGKVFLNGSHLPLRYTSRVLIVTESYK